MPKWIRCSGPGPILTHVRRALATLGTLALVLACAACGEIARFRAAAAGGGAPPGTHAGPPGDDWTTFGHDSRRTGYQPQDVGIDASNVGSLRLRWVHRERAPVKASPLVAGGRVYVATGTGVVEALDVRDGKALWTYRGAGDVEMTPTLADGLLFVGDHKLPGRFFALDAKTGRVVWSRTFTGGVRSEPLVADGVVYEGEPSADLHCIHGGVHALDERTGRDRWTWHVSPTAKGGGGVWAPLSYDAGHIYFGTSNSCVPKIPAANAAVALRPGGSVAWIARGESYADSDYDFGGGALLFHGQAVIADKAGWLYDLDAASGRRLWATRIGNVPGYGSIGTPSTDGGTIVVSAGYDRDPTTGSADPGGTLVGLDGGGHVKWSVRSKLPFNGIAAIANGIAYLSLDDGYAAIDVETGAALWRFPIRLQTYGSPAVVPSGVYYVHNSGDVMAFEPKAGWKYRSSPPPH